MVAATSTDVAETVAVGVTADSEAAGTDAASAFPAAAEEQGEEDNEAALVALADTTAVGNPLASSSDPGAHIERTCPGRRVRTPRPFWTLSLRVVCLYSPPIYRVHLSPSLSHLYAAPRRNNPAAAAVASASVQPH